MLIRLSPCPTPGSQFHQEGKEVNKKHWKDPHGPLLKERETLKKDHN